MKVPYLDLKVLDHQLKQRIVRRFSNILDHGRIIDGPELGEFEDRVAKELGVRYAVGVSSGSSALLLALKASGIGFGDEVITTPYTWIITVNAISEVGAKSIFVDVRDDFNIDPNKIEEKITSRTKAIVPMHVAGHMCDMASIQTIAVEHNLMIVEDAAQAFCASYGNLRAGNFSTASAFSMNPMKVLHGYGESGVVTTKNRNIYNKIRKLRHAGTRRDRTGVHFNLCDHISLNHKMDTIQAAFLLENLDRIDEIHGHRNKVAEYYDQELTQIVARQLLAVGEIHGRYLYLISCPKRNRLRSYLADKGIETKIVYSPLACDSRVYQSGNQHNFPVSRRLLRRALSLPLHEKMTAAQVDYVVSIVNKFYRQKKN